jgi:Spy/CpxP family protein refolding chaperone
MNMFRITALAIACAMAPLAALAQTAAPTPANKVDCEKAKMKWDDKGGKDGKGACVAAPAEAKK